MTLEKLLEECKDAGVLGRIDIMTFIRRLSMLSCAPDCVKELEWEQPPGEPYAVNATVSRLWGEIFNERKRVD